jgi:hypothetical protein
MLTAPLLLFLKPVLGLWSSGSGGSARSAMDLPALAVITREATRRRWVAETKEAEQPLASGRVG